jgi:hypothetical protein
MTIHERQEKQGKGSWIMINGAILSDEKVAVEAARPHYQVFRGRTELLLCIFLADASQV